VSSSHLLLRDPNTDLGPVSALIKRDAALAAALLRVSNSAVYGTEAKVGCIEDAVSRVGFAEVYRITGMVAVEMLADRALTYYGISAQYLRDQMLETAFVAECLAEACDLDPRTAYTAGLLRPIGILILDRVARLLGIEEGFVAERDGTYLQWEGIVFGIGSPDVAALILADWNFPSDIVEAVRDQYFNHEFAAQDRLGCILNLAGDWLVRKGRDLEGERRHWRATEGRLAMLGLSERDFTARCGRASRMFELFRPEPATLAA
jgi:HD-like signal output (HDOD) protein